MGRLIVFDYGSTLAYGVPETRPVFSDTADALTNAANQHTDLSFGVSTNGSAKEVLSFLEMQAVSQYFETLDGKSLVLGALQEVQWTRYQTVPAAKNILEFVCGRKSAQKINVTVEHTTLGPKPSGDMLRHMMHLLDIENPRQVAMIGDDTYEDGGAAESVGANFVYTDWRNENRGTMQQLIDQALAVLH